MLSGAAINYDRYHAVCGHSWLLAASDSLGSLPPFAASAQQKKRADALKGRFPPLVSRSNLSKRSDGAHFAPKKFKYLTHTSVNLLVC